jgi:hypothetical protein
MPPLPEMATALAATGPRLKILSQPRFALIGSDLPPGQVTVYLARNPQPVSWTPITTLRRLEPGPFEIRDYDHTNENRYYKIQWQMEAGR